jgi:NitT/TauT family transport system permease protein
MNELTWRSTVAVPIATSVALLVTWELVSIAGLVPPYVLPAPSVILSRLGTVWPSLAGHSFVTVVEIVLGFLLAVVVGGALALVIVYYPPFEATVAPYLLLPNALPNIFAGMKVAITLATVGAIVGEFVGANEGLGYVILFANGTMDTSLLFSALVVLSVVAFLLYAVIGLLQSIFVRWHVSQRVGSSAVTM